MFKLLQLEDTVVVEPRFFKHNRKKLYKTMLNDKYLNKIIENHGLVCLLYKITNIGPRKVPARGNGCEYVNLSFSLVMYDPPIGFEMVGRIKGSDPTGILISQRFFINILIPKKYLPAGSFFDEKKNSWCFWYESKDLVVFEQNDLCRFRIMDKVYQPRKNAFVEKNLKQAEYVIPEEDFEEEKSGLGSSVVGSNMNKLELAEKKKKKNYDEFKWPYTLYGSFQFDGTGAVHWW